MLDGAQLKVPSKSGKRQVKAWSLPDSREDILYKAVHMNHPCTAWTAKSNNNYTWHYAHFVALCEEYTYRYGKIHATDKLLREVLKNIPNNIEVGYKTQFPLAMNSNPECMFPNDPVKSYRMFYQTKQDRFSMIWTNRDVPEWFKFSK